MTHADRVRSADEFDRTPMGPLITTDEIAAGYEILLRRKADEAGLRYWQSRSTGGLTLLKFMIELLRSDEFRALKRAESHLQPRLAARPTANRGPRTLVVRGDINSGTGYSRAIELYTGKIAQFFERVVGVDLHFHPSKHIRRWQHKAVDDAEVIALLSEADRRSVVLNATTPDRFTRFSGAKNVGLFFWESNRISIPAWKILSIYMDEIWAPTRFQLKALTDAQFFGQLRHVPCPFPTVAQQEGSGETNLMFREIGSPGKARLGLIYSLRKIRSEFAFVVLTIGTFLPRKGFPILAHDWAKFARANPDAALLVKTSSIDVNERPDDLFGELADAFLGPARRMGLERTRVFLNTATISDAQVDAAITACDAYVACSYGEGFGLGLFESLGKGKPVACPRNSAFHELLPSDYPYFLDTDYCSVGLPDRVGLQSISSSWGIPKEGALAAALKVLRSDMQDVDFSAKLSALTKQVQLATSFDFSRLFQQ